MRRTTHNTQRTPQESDATLCDRLSLKGLPIEESQSKPIIERGAIEEKEKRKGAPIEEMQSLKGPIIEGNRIIERGQLRKGQSKPITKGGQLSKGNERGRGKAIKANY